MNIMKSEELLLKRIILYCNERFPPVAYSLLVCLFFWSAMIVFGLKSSDQIAWLGGGVMWLVFFHLRIFDEFKDFEEDRWAYPERVLSRGLVNLAILGRLALGAIILEAIFSRMIGSTAFWAWIATLGFSILMRLEFGLGYWLERRMILYAITHNPIVACLAVFAFACTGSVWQDHFIWYILTVSLASLGFEFARKMNQPEEEHPTVHSYSSVYGLRTMLWVLRIVLLLSWICAGMVLQAQNSSIWGWLVLGITGLFSLGLTHPKGNAKKFEASGTLFLLLAMLAMIIAPW